MRRKVLCPLVLAPDQGIHTVLVVGVSLLRLYS